VVGRGAGCGWRGVVWVGVGLVALFATPAAAGTTAACRRACADEVAACVATGERPRVCRRTFRRACRQVGLTACLVPGESPADGRARRVSLLPPGDVTADAVSGVQVAVRWRDTNTRELAQVVERSRAGSDFVVVATVGADVTAWTDDAVAPGATYAYRLRATGPRGTVSAYSNVAATTTPVVTTSTAPEVSTRAGIVRGTSVDGVRTFFGIPYAAPPVGALRWRSPAPAVPWTGVRDATRPGSICPQQNLMTGVTSVDEDCLFLNVFAPDPAPARPAPVLVWIHGGGFAIGDGREGGGGTDGDVIARRAGAVVVTLNYRLGPLGFLAHRGFQDPASGNFGLADQVAALAWVRDNIAAFGGDPANVTIAGESAGGWAVCAHLVSHASAGLFQRAIVESNSCTRPLPSLAAAEAKGDTMASRLGCATASDPVACMRTRSTTTVLGAMPTDLVSTLGGGERWTPTLDGVVLHRQIAEALLVGDFRRVPVLIGSNRDEMTMFVMMTRDALGNPVTADEYPRLVSQLVRDPATAAAVLAFYPVERYPWPGAAWADVLGDATFACPTIWLARTLARQTTTWLYQFDYRDAPFVMPSPVPLGAYHGAEMQYVFGRRAGMAPPFSDVEDALSRAMTGYWTRFAATGNPNGAGAVVWPQDDASDPYLAFDAEVRGATGAKQAACTLWAGVYGW
jgi:para-nitrobenzyl esterase